MEDRRNYMKEETVTQSLPKFPQTQDKAAHAVTFVTVPQGLTTATTLYTFLEFCSVPFCYFLLIHRVE